MDVEGAQAQETLNGADGPGVHMLDVEFGGGDDLTRRGTSQTRTSRRPSSSKTSVVENKDDNLADEEDASSVYSDRSSFSVGAVNDLEKELCGNGAAAAAEEAPHLAKLAETATSSARTYG